MSHPSYIRASLLDRLIDTEPQQHTELRPLRGYTRTELYAALRRDLAWLLNTRCGFSIATLTSRQRTVIDYGIPDFGTFYSENEEDWARLQEILEQSIRAYEPRLQEIRVHLERLEYKDYRCIGGTLEATLKIANIHEPLAFQLLIEPKNAWKISLSDWPT